MKKVFLLFICLHCCLRLCALDFTVDNVTYTTLTGTTVQVTGCNNNSSLVINETVNYNGNDYTVSSISSSAFSGKSVRSLYINMENIPANSFQTATILSLIIGPTVKTIGQNAFNANNIKKTIWLPNVVPSLYPQCALGKINYGAVNSYQSSLGGSWVIYSLINSKFEVGGVVYVPLSTSECDAIDCNYTTGITSNIGSTVTYSINNQTRTFNVRNINEYACYNCSIQFQGNRSISNNGYVGNYAFYNTIKSTTNKYSTTINNNGYIGIYTFGSCSFDGLTINSSVGNIGSNCFINSTINGNLSVNNTGYISELAFYNAQGGFIANIGNTGYIGTSAFENSNISELTIASSVKDINTKAFYNAQGGFIANIGNTGIIGASAFENSSISDLTITSNVYHIYNKAFYNVQGTFKANIGSTGYIGESAFENTKMSELTIASSVKDIDFKAFYNVQGAFNASISNSGALGDYAFSNSVMNTVTIDNHVTDIGNRCFQNSSVSTRITFANSGTVGISAFKSVTGNCSVNINSAGIIPDSCFYDSRIQSVNIGNRITTIRNMAFAKSSNISTITLPNNVDSLGTYTFAYCTSLANVSISRGLKKLPLATFSGCSSLRNITVPKEINQIDNYVFNGCTALTNVTFEDKQGTYTLGRGGTSSSVSPLFADCHLNEVYVGGTLNFTKDSSPYSPFYGNRYLYKITFADVDNWICSREFENCTNLQYVTIGAPIASIGSYAFKGCTNLRQITMGNGIKTIYDYAFSGCNKLIEINLKNTQNISTYAFNDCSALPKIKIPKSVTSISDYVFNGCTSLKTLIIDDRSNTLTLGHNATNSNYKNLTGVGTPLFASCPLDSVYIGGPITYDKTKACGYSPFFYNETLRTVFVNKNETTVYNNEFYNCLGLKSIKLGDGVKKIETFGFQSCVGLEYFEFANTLTAIGANAFSDCNHITKIISHATTPPVCGEQALEDINMFECMLYVPGESITLYQNADQWRNFFIYDIAGLHLNEIFYIRNVATGLYWGPGNTWGTHASLVDEQVYNITNMMNDGAFTMESIVSNGDNKIYFDGEYMDGANAKNLTITEMENGYRTISADGMNYGYDGQTTLLGGERLFSGVNNNTLWQFLTQEELDAENAATLASAAADNPVNATFLIKNPGFGRNRRDADGVWNPTGDMVVLGGPGDIENANYCAESWHSTFSICQTIENAPKGLYRLEAQGFYRQDGSDNENLPVFFMNDATSIFPVKEGAENSMLTAGNSFANGQYIIPPIYVQLDDVGSLEIGARLENNNMLWCIWDNFRLTYYGPDAEIPTEPDYTLGDINGDGDIDLFDIVRMVDYIMHGVPDSFNIDIADHNSDGVIDLFDLVRQVNLVLTQTASVAPRRIQGYSHLDYSMSPELTLNEDGSFSFGLAEDDGIIATQFILDMTGGMSLKEVTTDKRHTADFFQLSDNRYSVVCYSTTNKQFDDNNAMVNFKLEGNGTASISNAMVVTSERERMHLNNTQKDLTTGISFIPDEDNATFDIYSTTGVVVRRKVSTLEGLPKGTYIINGKKIIIK